MNIKVILAIILLFLTISYGIYDSTRTKSPEEIANLAKYRFQRIAKEAAELDKKIVGRLKYLQSPQTKLCFVFIARDDDTVHLSQISLVPCTEEVLAQIEKRYGR